MVATGEAQALPITTTSLLTTSPVLHASVLVQAHRLMSAWTSATMSFTTGQAMVAMEEKV